MKDADDLHMNAVLRQALGALIRRARLHLGWKLTELAEKCGVSDSVLCRVELGRREPSVHVLVLASLHLGVRLSDMIRMAEDEAFPFPSDVWTERPEELIGRPTLKELKSRPPGSPSPASRRRQLPEVGTDDARDIGMLPDGPPAPEHAHADCPHVESEISVELRRGVLTDVDRCTECGEPVKTLPG